MMIAVSKTTWSVLPCNLGMVGCSKGEEGAWEEEEGEEEARRRWWQVIVLRWRGRWWIR